MLAFREYVQRDSERLSATLIFFHCRFGLERGSSVGKYPMEKLCGMLLPLVRSWRCPYVNLQNQITMWVRFAFLKYKSAVIFRCGEKTPIWSLHWVFNVSRVAEKLYSPYSIYMMDLTQEQHLKEKRHVRQCNWSKFLVNRIVILAIILTRILWIGSRKTRPSLRKASNKRWSNYWLNNHKPKRGYAK